MILYFYVCSLFQWIVSVLSVFMTSNSNVHNFLVFTITEKVAVTKYHFKIQTHTLYEPRYEKTCLCHMRTKKAQFSMRICTVWTAPLLYAQSDQQLKCSLPGQYNASTCCSRNCKTLATLIVWALTGRNPKDRFSCVVAHIKLRQELNICHLKQDLLYNMYLLLCCCFTALRNISGHFGRSQLTFPHCSQASLLGSLPVLSAHFFASMVGHPNFGAIQISV